MRILPNANHKINLLIKLTHINMYKILSKLRMKDLEAFLYQTRSKFIGFHVDKDVQSLFGLPHPIHEGVEVFKQVLYFIIIFLYFLY